MSVFNTIGKNIKTFREKLGMSQEELSAFIGINRTSLSYYETGEREVPIATLEKISSWFGIDIADLLDENPENVILTVAFAFRANELSADDYDAISGFQQVVTNYRRMKKLLNEQ
jgi:transcriptional regulator with XRE-family HTH domain